MPVSSDTLLRLIRQTTPRDEPTRRVIGKGLDRRDVTDPLEEVTAEAFLD